MEKEQMIKRLVDANFTQVQADTLAKILHKVRFNHFNDHNLLEAQRLQKETTIVNMKIDLIKWITSACLLAMGIAITIKIIA